MIYEVLSRNHIKGGLLLNIHLPKVGETNDHIKGVTISKGLNCCLSGSKNGKRKNIYFFFVTANKLTNVNILTCPKMSVFGLNSIVKCYWEGVPKKHLPERNVHRNGVAKCDTIISLVLSPNLGLGIFEIGSLYNLIRL